MAQRILVIDDTQEILDLLRTILEKHGYEVHEARYIFEDLHEIEQLHPDLIILDFMIGKQNDGWHMLQALKTYQPTASIPVMITSVALSLASEQQKYFEQRSIPRLPKPFDVDYLLQTVRQMLQRGTD
jgi:CheY-like chemotaxis protein